MEDRQAFAYAPARTLMGKLQRGLGSGFLEALATPPVTLHPLLVACITNDPRLDCHLDDREWFYGELAFRSGLPVGPIEEYLVDEASDVEEMTLTALWVLVHLAQRGADAADKILRGYVTWGPHWQSVVGDMGVAATSAAWTSLAGVLAGRASDADYLHLLDDEPYTTWATVEPAIAALVSRQRPPGRSEAPALSRRATSDLLDAPFRGPATPIVEELARRDSKEDDAALLASLRSRSAMTRALGLAALSKRGSFEYVEQMAQMATTGQHPPYASRIARQALLGAPAETLLPLARSWRSSRVWARRNTALEILARHATEEDLGWLEGLIRRTSASRADQRFVLTEAAEIARDRFPGHHFPLLGRRFDAFTYSFGRRFLAEALAATEPSFSRTRAFTSLWDCQADVRLVGVGHVALDVEGAAERLGEMGADPLERSDVRVAAEQRLAARLSQPV